MLLIVTTQMTTSLNPELFSFNPLERTGFQWKSIPMRSLFSKSTVTNKSLEVRVIYWSGKANKCVLSRRSTRRGRAG